MSTRNREKRIRNQATRLNAREEAKRRARRRRWEVAAGGLVAALLVALVFLAKNSTDDKSASSTTTTGVATTTVALQSAAGKPCVAVSDPLPSGAPKVPVKVGPPPIALFKKDLKVGTGATVKPGANITANYIGVACSTGKIFDSSYSRGQPDDFSLAGGVIKGWTDGIPGMKVGGVRLLGIPSDQAYGAQGNPGIAPDETLWFVVSVDKTS